MRIKSLMAALAVLGAAAAAGAAGPALAAEDVADIDAVVAEVEALGDGTRRALSAPGDLYRGDRLHTGPGARLHATFVDGGTLMLGEEAVLEIDQFLLDADEPAGAIRVAKGAFRLVTGALNKRPGGALTLRTPVATIGVRGTDFWGMIDADSLTMALIDDGELSITLPTGTVVLSEPMTLVRWERGQGLPTMTVLTEEQLGEAVRTVLLPE